MYQSKKEYTHTMSIIKRFYKYIEMCKQAIELQKAWVPKLNQRIYDIGLEEVCNYCGGGGNIFHGYMDKYKEIPTKEKLQKYVKRNLKKLSKISKKEAEWIVDWNWGNGITYAGIHYGSFLNRLIKGDIIFTYSYRYRFIRLPNPEVSMFYIWIPYQEELQNLVKRHLECTFRELRKDFGRFVDDECDIEHIERMNISYNELWLAYTMKRIHNIRCW